MKITTLSLLAGSAFALSLPLTANAATLTAPNASFNWTDTNAWNGGTATWNSATPDDAIFGAITADRTATLTSLINAGDISFSNATNVWNVSGTAGNIDFSGTLSKTGAGTAALSTNTLLTGAGAVTVDGGELQLLNNANTFSGGVTLNNGTLRLGNNSGTGNPQTAGSLGTGTFTINGGSFYHTQGNGRTQAVNAVIGGNFTAFFASGGGLTLGNTAGTRTVSIGNAVRTITVGVNSDGTGANALLGFQSVTNGPGGGIIKEGEGYMRLQGSGFNGSVTANAGTIEITGTMGVASYVMNSGTTWRNTSNNAIPAGGTMVLNDALLMNGNTGANRNSQFAVLQVSGTSTVFLGSGLTVQSTGSTSSGFNVRDGGILGGNGTLRTTADATFAAGVATINDTPIDSAITLSAGGSIRPGTVNSLNSTIGDLAFGSLTWNGEASAIAQMAFNLSGASSSDQLSLSGALTKGTGSNFVFDFLGFNAISPANYTLMTFASQTGFVVGDFSATGITFDPGFSGSFALSGTSLQYVVIPEPSTWALVAIGLTTMVVFRRRRSA
jgi:fibronectin-binding autotransporter adhesin